MDLAVLAARLLGTAAAHISFAPDHGHALAAAPWSAVGTGEMPPVVNSLSQRTMRLATLVAVADTSSEPSLQGPEADSTARGCYLGVPLMVRGHPVGALCVHDPRPRDWSDEDRVLLQRLAGPVEAALASAALASEYEADRLLWRLAVDVAGVGAWDWNLSTDELRWDERMFELFGTDPDTFGGTIDAFKAAVHPDDRDRVSEALAAAVATCGRYEAEYRIVRPDGGIRWISGRGSALPGNDGSAVRVVGAAFDSTPVQEGEARVARVLEAMPTAFFQLDPEWRFTYVNSNGRRLLGGIGVDLVGGVLWELFPEAVGSEVEEHYRRAVETGEPVEFETYYPPPLARWYDVRAWPTPDGLSVYFIDITERRRVQALADEAGERSALLARITDTLVGTLDIDEAVAQLARLVAGPLADWSVVTLIDDPTTSGIGSSTTPADAGRAGGGSRGSWRRGLRDVAGWHVEPSKRAMVARYVEVRLPALTDGSFLARALLENRPVVVADEAAEAIAAVLEPGEARDLCRALAPTSAAVVPLRGRGRTVGLLTVFRDGGRGEFTTNEIAVLADAAGRAGLALDNARLYAEQRELAEGLQRSLLTAPPEPDHLHVVVRYEPAAEAAQAGGDWYDAFLQPDGATMVVIGDVVGHDTEAAAAMGQLRGLLRGIAVSTGESPANVLRRVDGAMETLQLDTTATAVIARLEQAPGEGDQVVTSLRWPNAGHPPPVVAVHPEAPETPEASEASRSAGNRGEVAGRPPERAAEVTVLQREHTEMLLGLLPGVDRTDGELELSRGTTVLLYTDGLGERRGEALDDGIERLRTVVGDLAAAGLSLDDMCDELLTRMLPECPDDDVALVAVRLHPRDRPRPTEAGAESPPPSSPPPVRASR